MTSLEQLLPSLTEKHPQLTHIMDWLNQAIQNEDTIFPQEIETELSNLPPQVAQDLFDQIFSTLAQSLKVEHSLEVNPGIFFMGIILAKTLHDTDRTATQQNEHLHFFSEILEVNAPSLLSLAYSLAGPHSMAYLFLRNLSHGGL